MSTRHQVLRLRVQIRAEADDEGDGGFLFNKQTAAICACNGTAWTVVQRLRRGGEAEDFAAALVAAYDVTAAQARKDVLALIKELRSLDMLEAR